MATQSNIENVVHRVSRKFSLILFSPGLISFLEEMIEDKKT
jgi:hypothetical protein